MRFLKLGNKYLVQHKAVEEEKFVVSEPEIINHIWIFDRSGSMYYTLPQLIEDLIVRLKQIPIGHTITIAWFSTEGGEYNVIIKGHEVTGEKSYKVLEEMLRKHKDTVGLTCFSEVLKELDTVIEDLSVFSKKYALWFLTDGYPVVSNYEKEKAAIFTAIQKVAGRITSSLLVGYGNYYNKDLLLKMAEEFGGDVVHSNGLPSVSENLQTFIEESGDCENKITVQVNAFPTDTIFSISNSSIITYATSSEGSIRFAPTKKKSENYVYVLTDNPQITEEDNEVILTLKNSGGKSNTESLVKAAYAAAYILIQRAETDKALGILSVIGDKALIDAANNAFTPDEYGVAEDRIKKAITSPNARFLNGYDTHYLPADDAFCIIDFVDLMQLDSEAHFYPYDSRFNYTRIGVPSITKDGYAKFEHDKNVSCPFSSITLHKTKLNLSARAYIPGIIKLGRGYKKAGFTSNVFKTYVYRNYTLVRDGFLNIDVLPMSMSQLTFNILQNKGMIYAGEVYEKDKVYAVNLKAVPVMNRVTANGRISAKELFKKVYKEFCLTAKIKALKFLKNELQPEKVAAASYFDGMTEDQVKFLFDSGVTNNGYAPPSEKANSTDYYMASDFIISMEKLSSLPKVEDVRFKIEASKTNPKKKLTPRVGLVAAGLEMFENSPVYSSTTAEQVEWLDTTIKSLQTQLSAIRQIVQRIKFAIILGKKWFNEFSSRDENQLTVAGILFTVTLKDDRVDL